MLRRYSCLMLLSVALIACSACRNYESSTDREHFRMDQTKSTYGEHFTYMADNALMHDMSLVEMHFIPHSSEISGVGAARLERMARILNTYGGTVRYAGEEPDPKRVEQRLDHIREYLALSGCNMERVTIEEMISGGGPAPAEEAVQVYQASQVGKKSDTASSGLSSASGMSEVGNN